MIALLPVVILAVAQITMRLIGVAATIWQERARANSHCVQMRTAAAEHVVLLERRQDGTSLEIVPQGKVGGENAPKGGGSEEAPIG
jgi:hypothetical protein